MELKDSHLTLESRTRDCGFKSYKLQWLVRNFWLLKHDAHYFGPYVQMGNLVCRFELFTSPDEFPHAPMVKNVYVVLANCPTSVAATITILRPDGDIQYEDENPFESPELLTDNDKISVFQVDKNTADLVVLCTVQTDLQGDKDFICKAVCAGERCTLSGDIERLLRNEKYSDIDLLAGGRTFKAHKAILYSRSSYLAEILRTGYTQELMTFDDIDGDIFEELLNYIYTQKTKPYSLEIALQLLPLSETFKLEPLKLFLIEHLVCNMSVEFALWLVVHAHKNQLAELESCAIECIGNNLEAALELEDWQEFRNYKELVDQLLSFVARRFVRIETSL